MDASKHQTQAKETLEEGEIVDDENNNNLLVQDNNLEKNEDRFDMHPDLLRLGWRKQFSKRENRPYYYNILNKQSVWSLKDINFSVPKNKCNSVSSSSSVSSNKPYISPNLNNDLNKHSIHHKSFIHKKISPRQQSTLFRNNSPFDDFIKSPASVLSTNNNSNLFSSPVYSDKQSIQSLLSSADEHYDLDEISPIKRRRYEIGNWDFSIKSNVVTYERPMSIMLPPNHEIELNRFDSFVLRLRDTFFNQIYELFPSSIASLDQKLKSSLELKLIYWLIETKLINFNHKTIEPFFIEANELNVDKESFQSIIVHDLIDILYLNELNIKFKESIDEQNSLSFKEFYISLAKELFMSFTNNNDSNKYIKTLYDIGIKNVGSLDDKVKELKDALCHDLIKYFKENIKTLFDSIIKTSIDISLSINNNHRDMYNTEHRIKIINESPDYKADKKIMCYPFLMCTPSPLLTGVTHSEESSHTILKYAFEEFNIKSDYFKKLKDLYKLNSKDDPKRFLMIPRIWSLLKRYQLINQNYDVAGDVNDLNNRYLFYTLKSNVFYYLAKRFEVTFELFTCPLMNYFPQYCSFFCDIDSYFGSRGSLFNLNTLSGSFVAVLPYSINFIEKFIHKVEDSIDVSNKGDVLSFIVVVPLVENEKLLIDELTKSSYIKKYQVLEKFKHKFKSFNNYIFSSNNIDECLFNSSYNTFIGFYQNLAAYEKYHIDEFDLNQLNIEFN